MTHMSWFYQIAIKYALASVGTPFALVLIMNTATKTGERYTLVRVVNSDVLISVDFMPLSDGNVETFTYESGWRSSDHTVRLTETKEEARATWKRLILEGFVRDDARAIVAA